MYLLFFSQKTKNNKTIHDPHLCVFSEKDTNSALLIHKPIFSLNNTIDIKASILNNQIAPYNVTNYWTLNDFCFYWIADYPLVYTTFPGEIASPGYPVSYPPFSKFEYLIHARPTEVIIITFSDFHLEAPHFTQDDLEKVCFRLGFTVGPDDESDTLGDCLDMIEDTGHICGRNCYIPCDEDTAQDFVEVSLIIPANHSFSKGVTPFLSFEVQKKE